LSIKAKIVIELTVSQLADLLSNRVSKMRPVISWIRENVQDKVLFLENELDPSIMNED